jgi:hypothetical protein
MAEDGRKQMSTNRYMGKLVLVVAFLACGCSAMMQSKPYVPAGYKACSSDAGCDLQNEKCSFLKADTFAVCLPK